MMVRRMLRAVREARDFGAAQRVIADALPPLLASILPPEQLQLIRQRLHQLPELSVRRRLTKRDGIGTLGNCLLSFLGTFLVVIPARVEARCIIRMHSHTKTALRWQSHWRFAAQMWHR
jgi:hypothetical protein